MFFDDDFFEAARILEQSLFRDAMVINKPFSQEQFILDYLSTTTDLDERSLKIFTHILLSSNKEGIYTGTYEDLMAKFDISRVTLSKVMCTLQEKGYLIKDKNGWKVANRIIIPKMHGKIIINFNPNGKGLIGQAEFLNKNPESTNIEKEAVSEQSIFENIDKDDYLKNLKIEFWMKIRHSTKQIWKR